MLLVSTSFKPNEITENMTMVTTKLMIKKEACLSSDIFIMGFNPKNKRYKPYSPKIIPNNEVA